MDRDLEILLKSFSKPKIEIPTFVRTPQEKRAREIIEDVRSKKLRFKPITPTHDQICSQFVELLYRYNRFRKSRDLPTYLTNAILTAYTNAEIFGMIDISQNEEIKKRDDLINEKNQKIAELEKRLADFESKDMPVDAFKSEVQEE